MIRNCFFFLDLSTFLDWPVFFHLFYILAISSAAGGRLCCQESGVDILTEPLFFKQHRRDHWQTHTLLKWDIILYVKVTIRCSTRISVDLFFFLTSSVKCMLMFFFFIVTLISWRIFQLCCCHTSYNTQIHNWMAYCTIFTYMWAFFCCFCHVWIFMQPRINQLASFLSTFLFLSLLLSLYIYCYCYVYIECICAFCTLCTTPMVILYFTRNCYSTKWIYLVIFFFILKMKFTTFDWIVNGLDFSRSVSAHIPTKQGAWLRRVVWHILCRPQCVAVVCNWCYRPQFLCSDSCLFFFFLEKLLSCWYRDIFDRARYR